MQAESNAETKQHLHNDKQTNQRSGRALLAAQAIKNANIKSAVMRNDVTIRQLVSQAVTR